MAGVQPRRGMSPADRQTEANAQVEAIARAYYEEALANLGLHGYTWEGLPDTTRGRGAYRAVTRRLIERGIIRPGKIERDDPPMEGQTTIYDQDPDPMSDVPFEDE